MKYLPILLFLCQLLSAQNTTINLDPSDTISYTGTIKGAIDLDKMYVAAETFPFLADLTAKYSLRNNDHLVDRDNEDSVQILTPVYLNPLTPSTVYWAGNLSRADENLFDGVSHTIYARLTQTKSIATTDYIIYTGVVGAAKRGFYFNFSTSGSNSLGILLSDSITSSGRQVIIANTNTNILPLSYFDIIIQIDFANKLFKCNIYNPSGTVIGNNVSVNISSYVFDGHKNYAALTFDSDYFAVSNFKKYNGLKTLSECQSDTTITGLQIHYPTIIGGSDVSGRGNHMTGQNKDIKAKIYLPNHNPWVLNHGYSYFRDSIDTYEKYYLPNDVNGNEIARTLIGYWRITDMPGNDDTLIYADYKLRFSNDFFDRSNYAIWDSACRASAYYDATHTKDFHVSEMDYRILRSYLRDGYAGRFYPKITQEDYRGEYYASIENNHSTKPYLKKFITELLLYNDDKDGSDNYTVLKYTRDTLMAVDTTAIQYDSSGYLATGYLKSNTPMFTIRLDDGVTTDGTDWKNFFDTVGVVPSLAILTKQIDSTGYISWSTLAALKNAGWEIMSHGEYADIDLSDSSYVYIDSSIYRSKMDLINHGITPVNFAPHLYGQESLSVRAAALKYFRSCHAGYNITVESANPNEIKIDNLRALRGDISGNFNIDNPTGIAAVKAQLDIALAQKRWVIIFVHGYTSDKGNGMSQVIRYAQSLGIDIVTLNEGLNNCKYY